MRVKFNRKCEYPQVEASQSRIYEAGSVHELDDNHARRWIRRGFAEEVAKEPDPPLEPKAAAKPEPKPEPKKSEPKGK